MHLQRLVDLGWGLDKGRSGDGLDKLNPHLVAGAAAQVRGPEEDETVCRMVDQVPIISSRIDVLGGEE